MEYSWTNEAYAKVAFHCGKYLSHALSGLLLGHNTNGKTQIVDAIPLFHNGILSSSMELALLSATIKKSSNEIRPSFKLKLFDPILSLQPSPFADLLAVSLNQVDDYATKAGLSIVGIYYASSMTSPSNEANIPTSVIKIVSKLKQFYNAAFVFMVNDSITQSSAEAPAGKLYYYEKESTITLSKQSVVDATALQSLLASSFQKQLYRGLCDYEDYLDDPSNDWTKRRNIPQRQARLSRMNEFLNPTQYKRKSVQ